MFNFFFLWRDLVEIFIFSAIIYYFSRWLHKDSRSYLLSTFYGICFSFLGAYCLQLTALTTLAWIFAPTIIIIFITLHQETLQRNFLALKQINLPSNTSVDNWLEVVCRAMLQALNHGKEVCCIVQQQDILSPYLQTPCMFNSSLQLDLLTMLLESNLYDQHKMIWVQQGNLIAINVSTTITPLQNHQESKWQQDALYLTAKTDALVLRTNAITRSCTLIAQGKIIDHLTMPQALKIVTGFIHQSTIQKGDSSHAAQTIHKNSAEQSRP